MLFRIFLENNQRNFGCTIPIIANGLFVPIQLLRIQYQDCSLLPIFIYVLHTFFQENLVESKHHKLARSLRSGPTDRDLKPNAATRDQLNVSGITQ